MSPSDPSSFPPPSDPASLRDPVGPAVTPPAVTRGELVRRVSMLSDGRQQNRTTVTGPADGRTTYIVRAACSGVPSLTYIVKVGRPEKELVRSDFDCEGPVRQDEIGVLPRGPVSIYLSGGPAPSAYAIVSSLE